MRREHLFLSALSATTLGARSSWITPDGVFTAARDPRNLTVHGNDVETFRRCVYAAGLEKPMLPIISGEIVSSSWELICCLITWGAAVISYLLMAR